MSQRGFTRRRGGTWTAYWQADTSHGRGQRSKGGFATRRDAQAFLTETLAAMQSGAFAEPSKVTVKTYLIDRWLPGRATSLRHSTFESYRRNIERHVIPAIGQVKLQQLSADQLDRLYAELLRSGLAPKTVRNIHTTIHKALKDAVRKNLVPRNAADAADAPKLRRPGEVEMQTWAPQQLRAFFDGIAQHRLAAAYVLKATTGMRRGEILGLRWRDVNIAGRRATIAHTILTVGYQITEGSPKTARGRRTIALDVETVRILVAHRARQRQEKSLLGGAYDDNDLVFARPDGRAIHPDYFSQTFDRTVKRLKLPRIRLHDLRHTHATLGLAAGIPVKLMSERLGHATSAFTQDVYMHAIPELEEAAADQIGMLVFGPPPGDPGQADQGGEPERETGTGD